MPAASTGSSAGGDLSVTYHVTDLVRSLSQAGRTTTYTLDGNGDRVRNWTDSDGSTTTTRIHHYADDTDSPAWTNESGGVTTRSVDGLGGMAAIVATNGTSSIGWQLSNLHSDIVATMENADLVPATVGETTEYGQPRNNDDVGAQRYGWLGEKQRAADTPSGVVLMGVRLYATALGRFLQVDPVFGGSCNAYDYACQDPANKFDLDGRCAHMGLKGFLVLGFKKCVQIAAKAAAPKWARGYIKLSWGIRSLPGVISATYRNFCGKSAAYTVPVGAATGGWVKWQQGKASKMVKSGSTWSMVNMGHKKRIALRRFAGMASVILAVMDLGCLFL
ncbi:RHS repeat-associated core domain-containing protein [Luedemannella flava]|uniref:RHS repeat-associated core domain-containing protein n=1 Tax=Luedemannella flava TaxID=349316 RepID=UPI0031E04727